MTNKLILAGLAVAAFAWALAMSAKVSCLERLARHDPPVCTEWPMTLSPGTWDGKWSPS